MLLVEDDLLDADLLAEALAEAPGTRVHLAHASTLAEALALLAGGDHDEVLLDLSLPDSTGLATLDRLHAAAPALPILVLTGLEDEELAIRAVRRGAQDYIVKGHLDGRGLLRAMRYALERKAVEVALRESEERFRRLSDATLEGVAMLEGCRLLDANAAFCRMFGHAVAELVGREGCEFVVPEDRERVKARVGAADGRPLEARGLRRDGSTFPLEVTSRAVPLHGREVRVVVLRDLTERERVEAERRTRVEQAREIERLKDLDAFKNQIIQTTAHELRTPLTSVRLQVHLLKARTEGTKAGDFSKSLTILDRNVERLNRLVQESLDVAKMQAGQFALRKVSMDIADAAAEAVEAAQPAAQLAGVDLVLNAAEPVVLRADPHRVEQVLANLLGNAVKFTPPGGRVEVELARTACEAVVRVRDTGRGIAPADLTRLFQPFTQVHDTMQVTEAGTGLGLYISRRIAEEHGGRIWAESEGLGKGSCFSFALPL
ncbi:MAG TPA: ATP-binding protein [Candidatus Thermoplasmatota archaeon]|nr:ATP-binding protein [Candidatus Thermoplasmatota archaeon]